MKTLATIWLLCLLASAYLWLQAQLIREQTAEQQAGLIHDTTEAAYVHLHSQVRQ
jgi:hypothetical protein